jgi:hypothetical protein
MSREHEVSTTLMHLVSCFRRLLATSGPACALVASVVAFGGCGKLSGLSAYTSTAVVAPDGSLAAPRDAAAPDETSVDATVEAGDDSPVDAGLDAGTPDAGDDSSMSMEGGCEAGLTACDGGCVDPASTVNCGSCGNVCETAVANAQPACTGGTCSFACNSAYGPCGGACIQYTTPANCGSCGGACEAGAPLCAASGSTYSCVSGCPSSSPTNCSGSCVDTTSNAGNCGSCGRACTTSIANAQPACVSSGCTFACEAGFSLCGGQCDNFATDINNCGGCGATCTTNVANAAAQCSGGNCGFACDHGYSSCGGGCVDYATDNSNCGGCAVVCSETCQSGVCSLPFGYAPSNFTATTYVGNVPATGTTVNCNMTYTSPGASGVSTWCGGTGPYVVPNVAQSGGPKVDVLVFNSLTVASGFTLTVTGANPVVFAVYGDASISGTINASASGSKPGAGGNNATYCGTAPQDSLDAQFGGGGGGGRAVAGGKGDQGNQATGSFDNGGTASGNSTAVPLLGGCSGEIGGNLCNLTNCTQCQMNGNNCEPPGAGGGGVQISAAGTVTVTGAIQTNGSGGTSGGAGQNGGGGGGSAGDILLEGTTVTHAGTLSANGGSGGSGGTNGGTGGSAGPAGTNDGSAQAAPGNGGGASSAGRGGGGGGGSYGFVVINAP